ncbi:putative metalloprotease CJM1_0395 family protein [Magnetospira sp. QH-2]|uniref:putative metalloprotease CJM1_0395 family protein n=1 Tax=Magnetospira sp. (strain QH-2) TaxID=1288970 RepID=UPI0003E81539|nr:putative metalloprotease CJM1_0395 family protein [Magnetospira sp. QH-2]CCQ72692.1 exported protein of unknown function [Magnetospira sp. QH-2]
MKPILILAALLLASPGGAGELPSSGPIGTLKRGPDGKLIMVAPAPETETKASESTPNRPYFTPTKDDHQTTLRKMQAQVDAVVRAAHRTAPGKLTDQEKALVEQLAASDRRVRAHENAHYTAGRPYTKPPIYFEVTGPDKKKYAISGQTPTDMGIPDNDPEAAIAKLTVLKRSALAPIDPSNSDRQWSMEIDATIARLRGQRK